MTGFWLLATLLLLLGYVFFIPVFISKSRPPIVPGRDQVNLFLFKQRQTELAQEDFDGQNRELLEAESARNLMSDLEVTKEKPAGDVSKGRIPLIVALCLAPMLILIAYMGFGSPDIIGSLPPAPAANDMEASIQGLAERLRDHPDDVEGWMLLGRSLQTIRQFDKAAEAYGYAQKLSPDDLDIKALYAEALADASQGRLVGKPAELIQEILQKDPLHKTALWMAGIAASESGDKKQAVSYWQKLKQQLPVDSPDTRQIEAYIAEMEGKPAPVAESRSEKTKPQAVGRKIRVAVTLAKELIGKTQPDDAVFIFARAAEGPPMPLAVVRKQVRNLPLEVSLDDTMSMMPGMNISSFERIVLGARISKTGKPTPTPGDLQGLNQPLVLENGKRYTVTISQVVGEK